ncbi:hypothetical protein [Mucilaginibacter endophyticus]|nr:hypothetical protein [Mucilaginibacter endophyticus]
MKTNNKYKPKLKLKSIYRFKNDNYTIETTKDPTATTILTTFSGILNVAR